MPQIPLFATPISVLDLSGMDALNRELSERLTAESISVPTVRRSNVGSWHSGNLAMRSEACFRDIVNTIRGKVYETVQHIAGEYQQGLPPMRIGCHAWAMVMRNGDYTVPHNHSEVHWGTVYYPDAGDADLNEFPESGLLAMIDPRQGPRPMPGLDFVGGTYTVPPKTSRLVVFPAWLQHYVHTYRGNRPRIAISCNCVLEPLAPVASERRSVPATS